MAGFVVLKSWHALKNMSATTLRTATPTPLGVQAALANPAVCRACPLMLSTLCCEHLDSLHPLQPFTLCSHPTPTPTVTAVPS